MIPTRLQALNLLKKYNLKPYKIRHSLLVAKVAKNLAKKIKKNNPHLKVNPQLIEIAALLHDIDSAQKITKTGQHGKIGHRILKKEGLSEALARPALSHTVDAVLDPKRYPQTIEEKIIAYADKRVRKDKIVTLKERFSFWLTEDLPKKQLAIFKSAYPKFQALEKEILSLTPKT